jgi:Carboxypeptidase regulatory-like domain/Leucine rich repeat
MTIAKLVLAGLFAVFSFMGCSRELTQSSQHGGSGTETVGIVGTVVDTAGRPVSGASVKLRRADFLDTAQNVLQKTKVLLADAVTNDSGKYSFGSIDSGAYKIEIIDGNSNGALLACTVKTSDSLIVLSNRTLKPTGSITGNIPPSVGGGELVTACVYGLEVSATTGPMGDFILSGLPEGTYSIHFVSNVPIYNPFDTSGVTIASGEKHNFGQLSLPKTIGKIFPPDSIALGRILDSNGLHSLSWQSVAVVGPWPFRITELKLDYKKLTALPADIGSLKQLQSISAQGNALANIPKEIGGLWHLKTLILSNNSLTTLPDELTQLDSLTDLDVSNNQLGALPGGMENCNALEVLDAGYNQLTVIPEDLFYNNSLKAVIVRNNSIDSLPQSIGLQDGLNFFDAQYNSLSALPWQITRLGQGHVSVNFDYNALCGGLQQGVLQWLNAASADSGWQATQICQ